jgi:hypothetical protein
MRCGSALSGRAECVHRRVMSERLRSGEVSNGSSRKVADSYFIQKLVGNSRPIGSLRDLIATDSFALDPESG